MKCPPHWELEPAKAVEGKESLTFSKKVAKNPESNDNWLCAEAEVTPCLVKWSSVLLENSERDDCRTICLVVFLNICFQNQAEELVVYKEDKNKDSQLYM